MKKLLLTLGGIGSIVVPVVSVVSCGAVTFDGVAWDRGDKNLYFNLNGSTSAGEFKGKFTTNGNELNKDTLIKLDSAVSKSLGLYRDKKNASDKVRDNNVEAIPVNGTEDIKMTFTGEFTFDDNNDKDVKGNPIKKTTRFTQKINFKLNKLDRDKERTVNNGKVDFNFASGISNTKVIPLETNFTLALLQGLFKQGFIKFATSSSNVQNPTSKKEFESFIWDIFANGTSYALDYTAIMAKATQENHKDLSKSIIFKDVDITDIDIS